MVCKLLAVYLYHYVMMSHTFHLCSDKDNLNYSYHRLLYTLCVVSNVGSDKEIYNRRAKIEESFLGYSILVVINFHIPYLLHANTEK